MAIYTGNHIHTSEGCSQRPTPPRAVYVRWGMDTSDGAARPSALASNLTIEMLKRTLKASAFACQELVPNSPRAACVRTVRPNKNESR